MKTREDELRQACEYVKALPVRIERFEGTNEFKHFTSRSLCCFILKCCVRGARNQEKKNDILCSAFLSNYIERSTDFE
jgi:hypothetical protein